MLDVLHVLVADIDVLQLAIVVLVDWLLNVVSTWIVPAKIQTIVMSLKIICMIMLYLYNKIPTTSFAVSFLSKHMAEY